MTLPYNDRYFNRGLDLFNRAHFFDAHEVLEEVWRAVPRDHRSRRHLRLHVQGMVQLAVAFHHQSTGNRAGACSVLKRALRNLSGAEGSFPDLDFDRLRPELQLWQRHLDDSANADSKKKEMEFGGQDLRRHSAPPLPKITRLR